MCKKSRIAVMLVVILIMQSLLPVCNIIFAKDQLVISVKQNTDASQSLEIVLEDVMFGTPEDSNLEKGEQTKISDENKEIILEEHNYEYSEAYLEWLALSEEEKANTIQPRAEFVKMSALKNTEEVGTEIPNSYNLKEYIDIKTENQIPYSNCYAYAGLNSIETNIAMRKGIIYDFSEMHIEYMSSTALGGNRTLNAGGNFQTVIDYSEELQGPVLESEISNKSYSENEYTLLKNAKPIVTVTETIEFPTINKRYGYTTEELKEFRDSVKSHIMENGSVYASIYFSESSNYYNTQTKGYACLDTGKLTNHAISIIGWDDTYSSDNFPEANKPIKDGAWIAINSWGSNFGDNGVFYISYEDNWVEYNMSGVVSTEDFVDTYGPKVELVNYVNENNTISTTINVYDIGGSGIDETKLKYQWTQESEKPRIDSFSQTLVNGETLTKTYSDGEQWYLWILAYDRSENHTISGAVRELIFTDSGFYNGLSKYALVNNIIDAQENDNGTYSIFMTQDQIESVTSISLSDFGYWYEFKENMPREYHANNIEGVENFINLKTLGLADNYVKSLKGINLPNGLETLNLSGNKLTTIEDIVFPDSLKNIYLDDNDGLTTVSNISWPSSLETLRIRNEDNLVSLYLDLPANVSDLSLDNNKNLKDVSIKFAGNNIEELDLKQCSSIETWENIELPDGLKTLILASCNLGDKIDKINFPTSIINLYIGDNHINDISCLSDLVNLEDLCISTNNITDISVISNFSKLVTLKAGDTYSIDGTISYFGNYYNQISSLDNISFPSTLKKIDLGYNKLTDISKVEWPNNLEQLYLDNNQINKIYLETDSIRFLDLNDNNINDITGIKFGENLTVSQLNLANNSIEEIPSEQWANSKICTIILSNNKISNINDVVWPKSLDSLALNYNNLTELDNVTWKEGLRYLILNNNNISEIKNIVWPKSLQALEIAGNNLKDLDWIENGTNLIGVALNENNICNIESLATLSKLRELHLDGNYVEDISALDELTSLTNLHVKNQSIIRVIEDQTGNIELPQIIKQTRTVNSKVYTENEMTLRNCEIEEENIKYNSDDLGYIFAIVSGGTADGTTVFITNLENQQFLKDIYTIHNKDELINVMYINNYGHFDLSNSRIELANNIDLGGYYNKKTGMWEGDVWEPIGNEQTPFTGIFEGNEYTITGLYINSEQKYQGIIGYNRGIIQNITVEGYIQATESYVGGICGYNIGTSENIQKIPTIRNAKSNVEINSTGQFTGGICGRNSTALIENCYNVGKITGGNDTGGVVGGNTVHISSSSYETTSVVSKCYNTGEVQGKYEVGGICGTNSTMNDYHGRIYEIKDCYNVGKVIGDCWVRRNSRQSK